MSIIENINKLESISLKIKSASLTLDQILLLIQEVKIIKNNLLSLLKKPHLEVKIFRKNRVGNIIEEDF